MANTQTQPPIVASTQLRMNVTQAVMTRMAAAKLEFDLARNNVQFVMGNQYFFRFDFKKPGQRCN